ncbi:MAG: LysR family transcriptional regulator [Planctomycetes bacterium]|nr:LysR family transcriptional regulator [Planctomycetota bacterium]
MYFETLKIFCDVVRYHSFSRGASANGVSQPAASQAVHQLERRLEVQLVDRSKRPWELTIEGKLYFEGCQDIVSRYLELEEAVRRRDGTPGYKVRVAAIYSVGLQDMSHYVERFREEAPGADVELEYMHPARVYETVLGDEADLGLIAFVQGRHDLVTLPWRNEEMVLACLPGHRLARRRSVRPSDLEGEPFVSFQKDLPIRREMDRFLRRHGVRVKVAAEFDNVANVKQAVEEGAGVAILPEPTLRRDVERRALGAVPFSGAPFFRPVSIIYRRKRRLNAAVLKFMDLLRQTNGTALPLTAIRGRRGEAKGDRRRQGKGQGGPAPAARRV